MTSADLRWSLVSVLLSAGAAFAQSADRRPPPPPPPEAFEVCADGEQGDPCVVTFGGHDLEGTCERFPGRDDLACRPDGPPPPPPPER